MTRYDLVLAGGRIVEPSQDIDQILDIAFADGKVAALGPDLKRGPEIEVRDVPG